MEFKEQDFQILAQQSPEGWLILCNAMLQRQNKAHAETIAEQAKELSALKETEE